MLYKLVILCTLILFHASSGADICTPGDKERDDRIKRYQDSVFFLWHGDSNDKELLGTASLIDDRGYFITAWHVVKYRTEKGLPISISSPSLTEGGIGFFDVAVYKSDEKNDIAILRIDQVQWETHKWVAGEGPFMIRYLMEPHLLNGYYIGYGKRITHQSTVAYTTDQIDVNNNKMFYLEGSPLGGDSGALLLDSYGFGVAIAIEKGELGEAGREFRALALGSSINLFDTIPNSEKLESFFQGIENKKNSRMLVDALTRIRDVTQIEIYKITRKLETLKREKPDAYEIFRKNKGMSGILLYAKEMCVHEELYSYVMEELNTASNTADTEDAEEIARSYSDEVLLIGVNTIIEQAKLGGIKFSKEAQQGFAFALNKRLDDLEIRSDATWGIGDMFTGLIPYGENAAQLIVAAKDMNKYISWKNEKFVDQTIVAASNRAKYLESSMVKFIAEPTNPEYLWLNPQRLDNAEKRDWKILIKEYREQRLVGDLANQPKDMGEWAIMLPTPDFLKQHDRAMGTTAMQ